MWSKLVAEALNKRGFESDPTINFRRYMEDAGFINIQEQLIQWPIGTWPKGAREKLIGRIMIDNLRMAVRPLATAMFAHFLQWTDEQIQEFVPRAEEDIVGKVGCIYGKV
jgi:hypothetical protein